MEPSIERITNPQSKNFRLLKRYIARADRFREEVLDEFADRFSLHVRDLPNLNPRWSYPGEPAFFSEVVNECRISRRGIGV